MKRAFDSNSLFEEYLSYYRNYYGNEYRAEQGLDEITDTIARYSKPGTWIDLGGGTSSFIWLPAFCSVSNAYSIDKFLEAYLVQSMVRKEAPSGCYRHILKKYNKSIEEIAKVQIDFVQEDLLVDIVPIVKADNVTQFGLLGLCPTKDYYFHQLDQLVQYMNESAVFIGANWVFSEDYSRLRNLDNSYIKRGIIQEWTELRGRSLLTEMMIDIQNDPRYDSVLVYAFS